MRTDGKAVEKVMALTGNRSVDVAFEAIGIATSFDICQTIVAAGGRSFGQHWSARQAGSVEFGQALVPQHYPDSASR